MEPIDIIFWLTGAFSWLAFGLWCIYAMIGGWNEILTDAEIHAPKGDEVLPYKIERKDDYFYIRSGNFHVDHWNNRMATGAGDCGATNAEAPSRAEGKGT